MKHIINFTEKEEKYIMILYDDELNEIIIKEVAK